MSVLGELISCARKLQQNLGGVLQDEQGTPLLALRIEQLRREVRDFEVAVARPRSEPP
jgi:FtsZ-interacting cell division protein ZipA